jgi:hypothetical protein
MDDDPPGIGSVLTGVAGVAGAWPWVMEAPSAGFEPATYRLGGGCSIP